MIIKKLKKQKKEIENCFVNAMALKLIYMGTPDLHVPILKSIFNSNHNVLTVYTQNPKKVIAVKK